MQRSLLTVVGVMALALAVPSAALAHHGHRHHHHHHGAHAQAHNVRFVHIGSGAAPTTTAPTGAGTPATPPTPENAGTVASYTNGILTLTLNDGSTVSGKVTDATRIGCVKPTPTPPAGGGEMQPMDRGSGEDKGQGDDQGPGDMGQQGEQGSGEWGHGDHDDDNGEVPGTPEPPCDSSALVAGAVVRAAELRIGPGGTEFESVWLVR